MKRFSILLAALLLAIMLPISGFVAYGVGLDGEKIATNDGVDGKLSTGDGSDGQLSTKDGLDNAVSLGDLLQEEATILAATPAHPKIKIVPIKKVNSFYKGCYADLYICIADQQIYDITMDETEYFKLRPNGSDSYVYGLVANDYVYNIQIDSKNSLFCGLNAAEKKTACKVNLHFASRDGKYSWTQEYKLPYEYVKPPIALMPANSTVYYYKEGDSTRIAGNHIQLQFYDKKTKTATEEMIYTVTMKDYQDKTGKRMFSPNGYVNESQIPNNQCTRDNSTKTFDFWFVGDKASTVKFEVMGQEWYQPMTFTYKVAVSTKAIKPKYTSKIVVNSHYGDTGYIPVSLTKTAYDSLTDVKYTYLGKGDVPGISISGSGTSLAVKCPKGVPKGNYKYRVEATCKLNGGNTYKLKPFNITVNVLDRVVTEKDLKLQKKGSSISAWPKKTAAYIYPTIKNVNAELVSVKCSEEDKLAQNDKRIALTPENADRFRIKVTTTNYTRHKDKLNLHLVYTYRVNGTGETFSLTVPYTVTTLKYN